MHFWLSTARLYGRVPVPRKTSLNWFMPALVNSNVGSSCGTTGDDGTAVWPCLITKKSMNCWRISLAVGIRYPKWATDEHGCDTDKHRSDPCKSVFHPRSSVAIFLKASCAVEKTSRRGTLFSRAMR